MQISLKECKYTVHQLDINWSLPECINCNAPWFIYCYLHMGPAGSPKHYDDVITGTIASQITSLTSVYSTDYSGADQSKHQSSASLAFVWGIHRGPVNSPHKWPVTRKMFPFDDAIMRAVRSNKQFTCCPICSLYATLLISCTFAECILKRKMTSSNALVNTDIVYCDIALERILRLVLFIEGRLDITTAMKTAFTLIGVYVKL